MFPSALWTEQSSVHQEPLLFLFVLLVLFFFFLNPHSTETLPGLGALVAALNYSLAITQNSIEAQRSFAKVECQKNARRSVLWMVPKTEIETEA